MSIRIFVERNKNVILFLVVFPPLQLVQLQTHVCYFFKILGKTVQCTNSRFSTSTAQMFLLLNILKKVFENKKPTRKNERTFVLHLKRIRN